MATRKHAIELALNFFSRGVILVHPKDISDLDDPQNPYAELARDCHIYLIVTRPRVTFVPGSVVVSDQATTVGLRYMRDGSVREAALTLNGRPNADRVEVSRYPHADLLLIKDGETFFTLPAHTGSFIGDGISDPSIRDLEVAYVGMAYGEGNRSAKDRLLSHSTLQQVLADLNGDFPDTEALIVMVEYEAPFFMMSIDGRSRTKLEQSDRNVGVDFRRTEEDLQEEVRIALVEAGLIRYFQPRYNEKYKTRYPHPTHKILELVYAIDFGGLSVELDTGDINARLFSRMQEPGFHHMASVDLHDPQQRQSFFNILGAPDGPTAVDYNGPIW